MRVMILALLAVPLSAHAASTGTSTGGIARLTAVESTIVLKVVHPVQTRQEIVALVQGYGGFPTLTSDDRLMLKVPPEVLPELMPFIADKGLTLEKSLVRQDVTETIAKLEGSVRSKTAILDRLRRFFDDSNAVATLQIEKNMTGLITELEQVKGELRVTRERAQWAVVQVHFQYREVGHTQYVSSPFEWLNTVDLDALLGRFEAQ